MNKSVRLKLGFIGGAINSAIGNTHQIAAQMDYRWRLESGCFSRNNEINKITAEKWCIDESRLYPDYRELLEKERNRLDAVVVLTPTPLHFEVVQTALIYGYPVICEKALAMTSYEGECIYKILNETKGFLAVTHNYTGYPMIREIRDLIFNGELGRINQIQIEMPQESFIRVDESDEEASPQIWRLTDRTIPTISLDLGVHLHHIIYFLSGQNPIKIVSDQNSFGRFKNIVDDVMCMAHYNDGMRGRIWYSKSALGHRNGLRVRIYGNKGSIEWFQMEPEVIRLNRFDGTSMLLDRSSSVKVANKSRYNRFKAGHPAGFIEAFANVYFDLADKLIEYKEKGINDEKWVYGSLQAIEGIRISEAIAESAREFKWVKL